MKKAALLMILLVILGAILLIGSSALIGGTTTNIYYTQENVIGNPASAEGFSLKTHNALQGHLHWDTTLTLGETPSWNTTSYYTTTQVAQSCPIEPRVQLFGSADFSMSSSGEIRPTEEPALLPYARVLSAMAQEAPPNALDYTKTVSLSSLMPNYPLSFFSDTASLQIGYEREAAQDTDRFFTQYFHVPTDGYSITISICTDENRNLTSVSLWAEYEPVIYSPGVIVGDMLYLAFGAWDSGTGEEIPGCAPSGIYRIPILSLDINPSLDTANMELFLPAEEPITFIDTMEQDTKLFFLSNKASGGYQGTWVDLATEEVQQTIPGDTEQPWSKVQVEEDYVVILSQRGETSTEIWATVWAKASGGEYRQAVHADISQSPILYPWKACGLYDHTSGRLLLAAFAGEYSDPTVHIALCKGNSLTYSATFVHNQATTQEQGMFLSLEDIQPALYLSTPQ